MTLLLVEGFDHGSTANLAAFLKGWTQVNSQASYTQGPTVSVVAGRLAKRAIDITTGTSGAGTNQPVYTAIYKAVPGSPAEIITGAALKPTWVNADMNIYWVYSTASVRICRVQWIPHPTLGGGFGLLRVVDSAGTVVATGTTPIVNGSWIFLETRLKVNGASGQVEVRLNGQPEIATTTYNFGSVNCGWVAFGPTNSFGSASNTFGRLTIDDIYVVDTAGAAPRNTFLGVCRVETLMPDADGANSQWTPNAGTVHFDRLNSLTGTYPDDDTTYNADATVGHKDTYSVDTMAGTGTVFGLQIVAYARKDDVAARVLRPLIRQGGTDNAMANLAALSTVYAYYLQIQEKDPTNAEWTQATLAADEFGLEVVS